MIPDSPMPTSGFPARERLERERHFHDDLAAKSDPTEMPPQPLSDLERAALSHAGDLSGKRVLDLGCGTGDLTLALIAQGAHVTAVDLSPGMVEVARQRVERYSDRSAPVDFQVAAIESLPIDDDSYDLAFGRFILHHLDLTLAPRQIARALVPGGLAIFIENSANNRLLMWAREHLIGRYGIPRYGTVDEKPLGPAEIRLLRNAFSTVRLAYPHFDFFTILDRQVLRYRWSALSWVCRGVDNAIWRLAPWARPFSFRVIVRVVV